MGLKDIRVRMRGLDLFGSRYVPVAGFCEHVNKLSGSIKCWELPD
jgi:hypothetical protein